MAQRGAVLPLHQVADKLADIAKMFETFKVCPADGGLVYILWPFRTVNRHYFVS
ncbi:hypothetical protein EC2846750_4908 [Escherichia coli 2846750]|nr:hypothetical protein EC2846750_4908 [Escherichia coli 2846750]